MRPVFAPLADYLDRQAPAMPVFAIEADAKTQLETVRQTVNLLTRLRADDSNDEYDPAYMMEKRAHAGCAGDRRAGATAEDIVRG